MIGRLNGVLAEKQPPQIVVDVNGVGYEVDVPMSTFYVLPHLNEKVTLFTHHVIREDAHLLYGFATKGERETFRQVLKISGIGPKIALAILSGMSADELAIAIAGEDVARLSKIPGIGKKTAERLVLELRGKLSFDGGSAPTPSGGLPLLSVASERSDIINALLALGYNEREAAAAIKLLPNDVGVSDGIRLALKSLAKV
ncbi:Holliday junction branch migration protein RuvA [Chitinivorax sp. B]|uniref:Holliday junction branch migration protein RuvA n=1 Tax=Chitinivorax sp. B TaxID=2502235 RepID=UPI0010F86A38|nr:Holliday junction branch migration protein RuvA [Chitinivorax sp. B]